MSSVIVKDQDGWERIVFAEVIIPGEPNVYGDFHTPESVRQFAYGFMINGFKWDRDHDNVDLSDKIKVVESFIARPGDPDFIEGSWVIGAHIMDDALWQGVLNGEINGYSYEAWASMLGVELTVPSNRVFYGTTEPDLDDGHVHRYFVVVDDDGRPVVGGTSIDLGHSHGISVHTITDRAFGHVHIYRILEAEHAEEA